MGCRGRGALTRPGGKEQPYCRRQRDTRPCGASRSLARLPATAGLLTAVPPSSDPSATSSGLKAPASRRTYTPYIYKLPSRSCLCQLQVQIQPGTPRGWREGSPAPHQHPSDAGRQRAVSPSRPPAKDPTLLTRRFSLLAARATRQHTPVVMRHSACEALLRQP